MPHFRGETPIMHELSYWRASDQQGVPGRVLGTVMIEVGPDPLDGLGDYINAEVHTRRPPDLHYWG